MAKKHDKAKASKKHAKAKVEKSSVQKTSKASASDVGYWRIIRDSLKFSLSPDKLLLVYLLMVPALLLLVWLGKNILSLGNSITELASPNPSPAVMGAVLGPVVLLIGYALVLLFAMTLVRVGIIDNVNSFAVGQKKSILASMKTAAPRFWSALGALILFALCVGLIGVILEAIPYIGVALSDIINIIIALIFLLFLQILVLSGEGKHLTVWSFLAGVFIFSFISIFVFLILSIFLGLGELALLLGALTALVLLYVISTHFNYGKVVFDSFKESYHLFIRRPAEVILMVLAMLLVEVVMVIVMAIVFLPFAYSTIISLINASAAGALDTYAVMTAINANFTMLAVGIFVVAILWAYLSIFTEAVRTLFYLRIRKL